MVSITDAPPAAWGVEEISQLKAEYPELLNTQDDAHTKYNPTPGTGRTGFLNVPPNNYPFYNDEEKYVPVMQADGGQLSGALTASSVCAGVGVDGRGGCFFVNSVL